MPRIIALFTYAAILPFLICAALPLAGIGTIPVLGSYAHIAASYAAIIASFMAGTHWGLAMAVPGRTGTAILTLSVILALAAWLALLVLSPVIALTALIKIFALLLIGDILLYKRSQIGTDYFRMRLIVTGGVILALSVTVITSPA